MKGTILYLKVLNVNIFEAKLLRPRVKANKKMYPEEVPKCVVIGSIFWKPVFQILWDKSTLRCTIMLNIRVKYGCLDACIYVYTRK